MPTSRRLISLTLRDRTRSQFGHLRTRGLLCLESESEREREREKYKSMMAQIYDAQYKLLGLAVFRSVLETSGSYQPGSCIEHRPASSQRKGLPNYSPNRPSSHQSPNRRSSPAIDVHHFELVLPHRVLPPPGPPGPPRLVRLTGHGEAHLDEGHLLAPHLPPCSLATRQKKPHKGQDPNWAPHGGLEPHLLPILREIPRKQCFSTAVLKQCLSSEFGPLGLNGDLAVTEEGSEVAILACTSELLSASNM